MLIESFWLGNQLAQVLWNTLHYYVRQYAMSEQKGLLRRLKLQWVSFKSAGI